MFHQKSWGMVLCLFFSAGAVRAGTLSGSFQSLPTGSNVNLTAIGKLDWVHWGLYTESSVDRKASVAPQISDFSVLGDTNDFLAAYQYSGNSNSYSWYDSSSTTIVTNTDTGVWAYGSPVVMGSGFQITVPADTQERTVQVFVGAYAAEGKLTASLSDGSATSFTNQINATVNNISNGPSGVFTLNYSADSAGQLLTITWTVASKTPSGNVTLQAAALTATNADNPPYITLTGPTNASAFAAPATINMQAAGQDFDGSITNVSFYANTAKLGETSTSPYGFSWANAPVGHYYLTALATDNSGVTSTSAPVELFVYGTGGSMVSSVTSPPPATVDLTSEGTVDWTHWGLSSNTSFDYKSGVARQISNFTELGSNPVSSYTDNFTSFSWTDGTPTPATNGTTTGIFVTGQTNGFLLTVPADTQQRQLRIYVGGYGVQADFQAYLSDLSAAPFSDNSVSNAYNNSYAVYTINYSAASAGQQLTILYRAQNLFDSVYGNVTLQAATLQGAASTVQPVYLTTPEFLGGGSFALSFATESNHNYLVEYTDVLPPTNWVTFTNISGTASVITVTNQDANTPQRFYRVVVQ